MSIEEIITEARRQVEISERSVNSCTQDLRLAEDRLRKAQVELEYWENVNSIVSESKRT